MIIKEADLKWSLDEERGPAFYFNDDKSYNKYRHWALSSLWLALRKYAGDFPDADEMATCLWTVFDDAFEEMEGTGLNFEVVENLFKNILYIDFDSYNSDQSDDENLNPYISYVHDFEKLAQEILDRDIFDLSPYNWGN